MPASAGTNSDTGNASGTWAVTKRKRRAKTGSSERSKRKRRDVEKVKEIAPSGRGGLRTRGSSASNGGRVVAQPASAPMVTRQLEKEVDTIESNEENEREDDDEVNGLFSNGNNEEDKNSNNSVRSEDNEGNGVASTSLSNENNQDDENNSVGSEDKEGNEVASTSLSNDNNQEDEDSDNSMGGKDNDGNQGNGVVSTPQSNDNNQDDKDENQVLNEESPPVLNGEGEGLINELDRDHLQELYKKKMRDLVDGIVPDLDDLHKIIIGRKWSSDLFRGYKYLNNAILAEDHQSQVLMKAMLKIGMDSEQKQRGGQDAVKKYLKTRIGGMRDYFMSQAKKAVLKSRTYHLCY